MQSILANLAAMSEGDNQDEVDGLRQRRLFGADYAKTANALYRSYTLLKELAANGSQIAIAAAEVSVVAEKLKGKADQEVTEINSISESSQKNGLRT